MKTFGVKLFFSYGVEYTSVQAVNMREALQKLSEHIDINLAYSVEITSKD